MVRVLFVALLAITCSVAAVAHDRSVLFFPLEPHTPPSNVPPSEYGQAPNMGLATSVNASWANYVRLWAAHYKSPDDQAVRAYLGLTQSDASKAPIRRTRAPVNHPTWPVGIYHSLDTTHFQITSRADEAFTRLVARDAERFYWAWTQMFYPFWEGSLSVDRSFSIMDSGESVTDRASKLAPLKSSRGRMKIVIFASAEEYQSALIRDEPGIAQSTGYYSDKLHTTFLYGSITAEKVTDAAATRFHELTHQLFREVTFSSLRAKSPGENSDFWLVEGIAGYMESLAIRETIATVGGWDSERLQYARYRTFVSGESLPVAELRAEGRIAVQRRSDLARWYAHAIAQTHRLLDGQQPQTRQWIFNRLAELYRINSGVTLVDSQVDIAAEQEQQRLRAFLSIDDEHLRVNSRVPPLRKLCLAGCEVTAEGLAHIQPSALLSWLDLSRVKGLSVTDVKRLCSEPSSLKKLSLEATAIDAAATASFLSDATKLEELDLSSTPVDDSLANAIAKMDSLETLWLTGSLVGDEVVDVASSRQELKTIDVQRTKVTGAGLDRFRAARPGVRLNPLEVR